MRLLETRFRPRPERSEAEKNAEIAGIMDYHLDLLQLDPIALADRFDDVMNDPTIVRQQSPTGRDLSRDKFFIYRAFSKAFMTHQQTRDRPQWRKFSDQPYIVHPMRVALLSIKLAQALGEPVTPELIAVALTHDVIEDSPILNGQGRLYDQTNVESYFGTIGSRGRKISEDIQALSHHDVHEDGKVNEQLYYEKIIDGDREALMRRAIVKAADRIDNLLDPLTVPGGLYKPQKDFFAAELRKIKLLDGIERVIIPYTQPRGLDNPPKGSLAEKIREQRIKYIEETKNPEGVISLLFSGDSFLNSFLRKTIQTTIDISQQTVYEPNFTLKGLRQQLADAMQVSVFDRPYDKSQEQDALFPEPALLFIGRMSERMLAGNTLRNYLGLAA